MVAEPKKKKSLLDDSSDEDDANDAAPEKKEPDKKEQAQNNKSSDSEAEEGKKVEAVTTSQVAAVTTSQVVVKPQKIILTKVEDYDSHPMVVAAKLGCFSVAFKELEEMWRRGVNPLRYLDERSVERVIRIGKMHRAACLLFEFMGAPVEDYDDKDTRRVIWTTKTGQKCRLFMDCRNNFLYQMLRIADTGVDPVVLMAGQLELEIMSSVRSSQAMRTKNIKYSKYKSTRMGPQRTDDRLHNEIEMTSARTGKDHCMCTSVVDLLDEEFRVDIEQPPVVGWMVLHHTIPPDEGFKVPNPDDSESEDDEGHSFFEESLGGLQVREDTVDPVAFLAKRQTNSNFKFNGLTIPKTGKGLTRLEAIFEAIVVVPLPSGTSSIYALKVQKLPAQLMKMIMIFPDREFSKTTSKFMMDDPHFQISSRENLEAITSQTMRTRVLNSEHTAWYTRCRESLEGMANGKWQEATM